MNPANISAGYGRVKSDREVEGVIREGYSAGALAMVTQNDWCAVQRLLLSRESRSLGDAVGAPTLGSPALRR
jgi:hypothetical protein